MDEFSEAGVHLVLGLSIRASRIPYHRVGAPHLFEVGEIASQRPHSDFFRRLFANQFPHALGLLRISTVGRNRAGGEALLLCRMSCRMASSSRLLKSGVKEGRIRLPSPFKCSYAHSFFSERAGRDTSAALLTGARAAPTAPR